MSLFAAAFLAAFTAPPCFPQEDNAEPEARVPIEAAPGKPVIDAAVLTAARFLLTSQENYEPDPPVGGIPEDEFASWERKEKRRIEDLRGKPDATEWPYEGVYRVRPDGRIPSGYRVGGTAIACEAILRAPLEGEDRKQAIASVYRGIDFILDRIATDRTMALGPKTDYDVRGWGHAYAIQLLLLALDQGIVDEEAKVENLKAVIADLIRRLAGNQTKQGGWNYANDNSVSPFMTGATLLILFDAAERGFEVDPVMIDKALGALEECSTEAMSYAYSGRARRPVAMPGSSARSSVATLALFKAGRADVDQLRLAVEGFFTGWDDLLVRKSQQGTHVGEYGIAPYYFFFGHTYAAFAIEELPEAERTARRDMLAALLWRTREKDGTWNDRIFPRTSSYSTAMSIQALLAAGRPAFAAWDPQ